MLALAVDARQARQARGAGALLEGLFARSPIGLAVFDTDVRFLRVNPALAAMNGVPAPAHIGRRMTEVLPGVNGEQAEAAMRRVLATGDPVTNFRRIGRTPADPDHDRVWSTSYYRLDDSSGRPVGVSAWIIDATRDYEGDLEGAPGLRRLELLNETSLRVGTTLAVARTGQELCDLAVPRLADAATVDVLESVSQGGETLSGLSGGTAMRRLGKSPSHGSAVAALLAPVGRVLRFPAAAPYAQALIDRRPFLLPRIDARVIAPAAAHTQTPEKLRQAGVHSLMMAPLMARGLVLGVVTFLRAGDSPAFDRRDVALAQDMAAHAALCIDNARLYNREHDTALTLQRSMLPPHPSPPAGIEIAHRYRPASDVNEVGGDRYDMTTLAPGEAALVIGDVMGHGIHAAAVMGQLRTTARALARLDVPPNLLLHQLDTTLLELDDPLTATCLYAVCDATTGSCRIARAGHPPPVLITPDGATRLVDLPTGAPLGIGGIRYSTTSLSLEPEAFLRMLGRSRGQVVGRCLADAFPDDPKVPAVTGMRKLRDSLLWVAATGERDAMTMHRYDVESADRPGEWEERYWSAVCVPVFGPDGQVARLLHWEEDITELVRARSGRGGEGRARVLETELYTRARELQEVNERLRKAHAREREVALRLQEAMLPALGPSRHHRAAACYLPAVGALNVCGDWYDLVDLSGDRTAVAVGDVVGHGLAAASVMGQLRSALSAACRVAEGPAQALEALGLYARSVEGAESTTALLSFIDDTNHTIAYSSAGHPPPALLHPDGTVDFLDQATDPPLGTRPEHTPRPQAETAFTEGGTMVLYTDGLIERRREDIDAGLARLADSLTRHRGADPETLADALLTDLIPPAGATDDTALAVVRL